MSGNPMNRSPLKRVTTLLALLMCAALVLTGCVDIPQSSPPQPIQSFDRKRPTNIVPTPRKSDDPETTARNFLKAMADPTAGHRSARKFLTPGASQRWDDQGSMRVLQDVGVVIDERTATAVRLRVTGTRMAVLGPNGTLRPDSGSETIPLSMVRDKGGWKVNGDVPSGSITDASQFLIAYRQVDLFFPDRTMTRLVGDPHWLYGTEPNPTTLVNRILAGPSAELTGAISQGAARGASLLGAVIVARDTVTIPLGNVTATDQKDRTALAAQLIWTLDYAGITGTYRITADGAPLVADRADGWRTADVSSLEPDPETTNAHPVHLIHNGSLTRLTGNRAVPVEGELGAAKDIVAAAISADTTKSAAIVKRAGRDVLLVGPYGGRQVEAVTGTAISSPSFGADSNTGYVLVDGRPTRWDFDPETMTARSGPIDAAAIASVQPGPITQMRVSPDGVRVALVVDGRTVVGVISVNDVGAPSLSGAYQLAPDAQGVAVDITWSTPKILYAARTGTEVPVWRATIAGTPPIPMVSGNLKPPVQDIAASDSTVYVSDTRGVQQLGTGEVRPDQYWTILGPDAGPGSIAVIPGS
ncbi:MAG: LpqB family beta-propeller domain-containing protein [Gordonia sp. (in: high G+C Gram-positive bacteria)]|uniref:LpqB family beta-propeller domain-containing protein n=1 Tax=Gordonia sp. (in: high G+C Gram-positive bacteria) TaxID=84139 RepID=UPI003C769F79